MGGRLGWKRRWAAVQMHHKPQRTIKGGLAGAGETLRICAELRQWGWVSTLLHGSVIGGRLPQGGHISLGKAAPLD